MGPSWYWMPDVFEKFFANFSKTPSDYYTLQRLDPSYRIVFSHYNRLDIPAKLSALLDLLETLEPNSASRFHEFMADSQFKYEIGMQQWVYKPGISITELMDWRLLQHAIKLDVFKSFTSHIRKYFKHPQILQWLEFPILFLGAKPANTPALYSLMNYADIMLGTWYPQGGMYKIIEGMVSLAKELGVKFNYNTRITGFHLEDQEIKSIASDTDTFSVDYVVASADYHHVEQTLLPKKYRQYSARYWDTRVLAPSCLIFYLGINKKLKGLLHHTLFFDQDFKLHAEEIYDNPAWPTSPQFYVSCTSITDPTVAPEGCENLFVLIPVAPGLEDNEVVREFYFRNVITRLEKLTNQSILPHIIYKRIYAHRDFIMDYNAYKGNAYGLANTLRQTANLKPSIINKKVHNLFYTGQLTVPGPGVPPAIISGEVVAQTLLSKIKNTTVV
jgi:phytoene desaturase